MAWRTVLRMTTKNLHGSCHCQRVKYEVEVDLARGSFKCNCTFCTKSRLWEAFVKPHAFKLLTGEASLTTYTGRSGIQVFSCATCGVMTHSAGDLEMLGGKYVGVCLSTIDDATPEVLLEGGVQFGDGRADAWQRPPAFTAHL